MKLKKLALKYFILTLSVLIIQSCDEREIIEKYTQTIPNSNLTISIVSYDSGGITGSIQERLIIADSNETISCCDEALSVGHIIKRPTSSFIEMVDISDPPDFSDKDTLLTPLSTEVQKIGNLSLRTTTYLITLGTPLETYEMRFKFSDVSENADSLIISGIDKNSNVRSFPNKQAFVKGDIKVVERDDRSIEYILVQEFIRKRGDVYYTKSPFEIVHNRPIADIARYYFYPKNKMSSSKISNNGIFKKADVK